MFKVWFDHYFEKVNSDVSFFENRSKKCQLTPVRAKQKFGVVLVEAYPDAFTAAT